MLNKTMKSRADAFLAAWNTCDIEKIAACYTENLVYCDPNITGEIKDQVSFKRYLKKLLAVWDMTYTTKEVFPLKDLNGYAFLWRAVIGKSGKRDEIEIEGMDLVVMEGDLISRNEVYFDRKRLSI